MEVEPKPLDVMCAAWRSLQALERHVIKLTDFGCACVVEPNTLKVGGGGTLPFLAPERLRGEPFSFAVDVWALGVIFFVLLTSRLPFVGVCFAFDSRLCGLSSSDQ